MNPIEAMPNPRTCPACGAPLHANSAQGLCPVCLMKAGLSTQPKVMRADLSRDPAFAERFAREARALAKLNHPNIVNVFDFGQSGGHCWILMEFVDGTNLRELLRTKTLQPREALGIVPKVCDALQYAHDEGIVHRDIKPENILLDKKGRVKIADFGLAKLVGKDTSELSLTATGMTLGTPRYMAPEQFDKPQEVDHRADIYSLGVVLYEMLTGEVPMGRFAPPSATIGVDVRLDEIVLRTLEKEPSRRYQHVSEVKTQVEGVASNPQVAVTPIKPLLQPFPTAEAKPSEFVARARASWFARVPQGVRTAMSPVLTLLALGLALAAMPVSSGNVGGEHVLGFGLPSPWLEFKSQHAHMDAGKTIAFHPFTLSFCGFIGAAVVLAFMNWGIKQNDLIRYGRRWHDLLPVAKKQAQRRFAISLAITVGVPILLLLAMMFWKTPGRGTLDNTFRLKPKSKAFEELQLAISFFTEGFNQEAHRRPNRREVTVNIISKEKAEPRTLTVELPSMKASYLYHANNVENPFPYQLVLDADELTRWLREQCKVEVKTESVKKEIEETMAFLKQLARTPPACSEEYREIERTTMPSFDSFGWSTTGHFQFGANHAIETYIIVAVLLGIAYTLAGQRIKNAAFELDRAVREHGKSALLEPPLPPVKFSALPAEIRSRAIKRALFIAGLLLVFLPGFAWRWESAHPQRVKETYYYGFVPRVIIENGVANAAPLARHFQEVVLAFSFESYERDSEKWFVQPKPLPLAVTFCRPKNFSDKPGQFEQVVKQGKGIPEGETFSFTVELPGLHATMDYFDKKDSVTLDEEELWRWMENTLAATTVRPEGAWSGSTRNFRKPDGTPVTLYSPRKGAVPELKSLASELMAFLKKYATSAPPTHDAFIAAARTIPSLNQTSATLGPREGLANKNLATLAAIAASLLISLALLPLIKRAAVREANATAAELVKKHEDIVKEIAK
ncbi:MAG: serine/threonine protein kinase [Verrucomicrobia bacterium]|nr:serine/threonine protein kinase [Verrucomicrobiota bacterium]